MYNTCCIETCNSRRNNVTFHMFPKSEKGLQQWLWCINCERLRRLSFQKLRKQFVCAKHFEKRFFSTTRDRVRLFPDAFPTLFTADEISSGIPETDALTRKYSKVDKTVQDPLKIRRHVDHTYCKAFKKHLETDNNFDDAIFCQETDKDYGNTNLFKDGFFNHAFTPLLESVAILN